MSARRTLRHLTALMLVVTVCGGAWQFGNQPRVVVDTVMALINDSQLVSVNELFSVALWGGLWILLATALLGLAVRGLLLTAHSTVRCWRRISRRGVASRLSAVVALGGAAVATAEATDESSRQHVAEATDQQVEQQRGRETGRPLGALASVGLAAGVVAHIRTERALLLRDASSRQRLARPPAPSLVRGATLFARCADYQAPVGEAAAVVVPLGMSGERLVQLQVQRGACVSVEAPPIECRSVLRHLINTIALAPWLHNPQVIAVGFDVEDVVVLHNIELCANVDVARTRATQAIADDPQRAVVLVMDEAATHTSVLAELHELGVTVIASATTGVSPQVRIQRQTMHWHIAPTGETFRPYGVSHDEAADLRTTVSDLTMLTSDGQTPPQTQMVLCSESKPASLALLRVLGPVELTLLDGAEVSFRKAKSLELVVWLAFHRERPTASAVRTALWEIDVEDATFHNVLSEARRGLSQAGLPDAVQRVTKQRLVLTDELITDADVLQHALICAESSANAISHDVQHALAQLVGELRLVRALPFADAKYVWADAEGITANLVWLVTRAVTQAVALAEQCKDAVSLLDALAAGLRMFPGDEQWSALMKSTLQAPRGDTTHRLADDGLVHL